MAEGPTYYKRGSSDVWDFIREQGLNFHLGNAIKYICRAGYKESKTKDLRKAIHYLENELHHEEKLLDRPGKRIQGKVQHPELPSFRNTYISEKSDC